MGEIGTVSSCLIASEMKTNSFYPMYFGVSCAFFALKVISRSDKEDDEKWSGLCDKMLQGSAQLLGLLVWRIQRNEGENGRNLELLKKLDIAEKEIKELRQMRREEAKANEKVVGIFASQEQSWFIERKKLRQQIGALINELRVQQRRKEEAMAEMNGKIKEMENLVESKDADLKQEESKRKAVEEKLEKAESVAEELRQNAKREAQEYSTDLWKHKTAFLELVSNQRQLEAELGRALRQLEAKRQEIESVLQKKEESVLLAQKLSMEVVRLQKDTEQKDKLLSAMLRKCQFDSSEKLLKKKQAECGSKHKRNSLRNMFAGPNSRADDPSIEADVKRIETYSDTIEKRQHHLEIDAFAEQMRLKDEKLEAFRWRMLSMEIESKRLVSHIESLDQQMSQLRHENMKLGTLLVERQEAFNALKEKLAVQVEAPVFDVSIDKIVDTQNVEKNEAYTDQDKEESAPAKEDLEIEEEKNVAAEVLSASPVKVDTVESSPSPSHQSIETRSSNNLPWRMDLQALGVSYKIKRLKQQLLLLERLTGKQESSEQTQSKVKGFDSLMALLNKQISRYQSLQSKIDELCKRMQENDVDTRNGDSNCLLTKGETKTLENFLEETFQVQRYMVATGQKLMEVQSKIGSGLVGVAEEVDKSVSFDTKRFGDNMRILFQEVQRGLEVRIARIIGDLEGTLACEGMIRMRK